MLRCLTRLDNRSWAWAPDNGVAPPEEWQVPLGIDENGRIVVPQRVMSHPSFPQVEGEGVYTYPVNPIITLNFIDGPIAKVDGALHRTVDSNILVRSEQTFEDVIITESWPVSGGEVTCYSEMARVFDLYWRTIPEAGQYVAWAPLDRNSTIYQIEIISVQLGGADYSYNEVRTTRYQRDGSLLDQSLTIQFKLVQPVVRPLGSVTLEGL